MSLDAVRSLQLLPWVCRIRMIEMIELKTLLNLRGTAKYILSGRKTFETTRRLLSGVNVFVLHYLHWMTKSRIIFKNAVTIECFHMTSQRPYWCPKTMKRRPSWCPKPVLRELNSFLMQTLSFVPINLHRCWSREWKHSIVKVVPKVTQWWVSF